MQAKLQQLWADQAGRMVRTFAQAAAGFLVYTWLDGSDTTLTGVWDVIAADWNAAGGVGVLAALAALGIKPRGNR